MRDRHRTSHRGAGRTRYRQASGVHRPIGSFVIAIVVFTSFGATAGVEDRLWCRSTTASLELVTDLGAGEAVDLIRALEQFRAQFASTTFQDDGEHEADRVPVRMIVFARRVDFRRVFRTMRVVGFMRPSMSEHTLSFALDPNYEAAFHEYTHYLVRSTTELNVPSWYDEGLASYLSSYEAGDQTSEVGAVPAGRRVPTRQDVKRLAALLSDPFPFEKDHRSVIDAYDLAWLLTHYLHHAGTPSTARFDTIRSLLRDIDDGVAPDTAFQRYWNKDTDALAFALDRYRKSPFAIRREARVTATPEPITTECLSASEVRVVLATISQNYDVEQARRWFDETIDEDPTNVDAMLGLSRLHSSNAHALVERARHEHPHHPPVYLRQAELALNACEAEATACGETIRAAERLFRRALQLADQQAAAGRREASGYQAGAAYGLGIVYLLRNQPGNALGYLKAANKRVPWAPRPNYHLGLAYRETGDDKMARHHLRKAATWDADPEWRAIAADALEQLSTTR